VDTIRITGVRHPTQRLGYIRIHIKCEDPHIDKQIPFAVDTGASITVLSEGDGVELGIDYDEIAKKQPVPSVMRGIGGSSLVYELLDVELWFELSEDRWYVEKIDSMGLMKHQYATAVCPSCGEEWSWRKEENAIYAKRIPSLLGIDVIQKYNIRFTDKLILLERP